jgi:TRAP transporter 4TM/12TM fusion protein
VELLKCLTRPRWLVAAGWLAFQLYILYEPLPPMIQRPVHIAFALAAAFLFLPLGSTTWRRSVDWLLLASTGGVLAYYLLDFQRLYERMDNVDPVLTQDLIFGSLVLLLLFEATRRAVGWSLLTVVLAFVAYGFLGPWFPGWLQFGGFEFATFIEIVTMATHGILGITTETSVTFVFYFIMFGVVYSATGGGALFMDTALHAVGRRKGGAAKSAIVSSALFGSVSGSAVANVVATGVFTIPLMKRTGYTPEEAGAHEATASTGGQLMPPVMGIAAFVMAELLATPYTRIALAGLIPALAYYFALYMIVDLKARRRRVGSISTEELAAIPSILPRMHLFLAPIMLIGMLVIGYSATMAAMVASVVAIATGFLRTATRMSLKAAIDMIEELAGQAAQVAVPIITIGVIIAVAIQSNLALKFSTQLISISGGTLIGAMIFIIFGCLVMGMGLPTVAAYIIGAILFVPAITKLGIDTLAAHFFVMYYCVLSMITPPVALASYAAAGLAKANSMRTGWIAFKLSFVLFLIPFSFAFDPSLLWSGPYGWIALAFVSMMAATFAWAVMLEGYLTGEIGWPERVLFGAVSLTIIFAKTGTLVWAAGCFGLVGMVIWTVLLRQRVLGAGRTAEASLK